VTHTVGRRLSHAINKALLLRLGFTPNNLNKLIYKLHHNNETHGDATCRCRSPCVSAASIPRLGAARQEEREVFEHSPERRRSPRSGLVGFVDDLVDPSQEPADARVHARERGVTAAVTPGDDSRQHPAAPFPLAHQRPPAVALAAVHAVALRQAAGTQHAAGEALVVAPLTLPGGQQGDPGLEQRAGVLRF